MYSNYVIGQQPEKPVQNFNDAPIAQIGPHVTLSPLGTAIFTVPYVNEQQTLATLCVDAGLTPIELAKCGVVVTIARLRRLEQMLARAAIVLTNATACAHIERAMKESLVRLRDKYLQSRFSWQRSATEVILRLPNSDPVGLLRSLLSDQFFYWSIYWEPSGAYLGVWLGMASERPACKNYRMVQGLLHVVSSILNSQPELIVVQFVQDIQEIFSQLMNL